MILYSQFNLAFEFKTRVILVFMIKIIEMFELHADIQAKWSVEY